MRRAWRIAVMAAAAAALLGGGGWALHLKLRKPPAETETVTVKRGRLVLKVSETGTVEPLTKVEVKSKVGGRISQMLVEEGDWVEQGQVIAVLEVPELESQAEQTRAQLRAARLRLRAAQENYETAVARNRRELERAQALAREAEARLAELKAGARPQEVAQAQAEVDQARARAEDADRTLQRRQELLDRGFVAQQEVDSARTQSETAHAAHEAARQRLALIKEGPRAEQVRAGEMQVEQAQAAVALAKAEQRRERAQLAAIEEARALSDQVARALEEIETRLADAVVTAPRSGQVIQSNVRAGELVTSGVTTFTSGMTICTIADLSRMLVRVYVNEVDMGKLRLDMPATIALDSLRGRRFRGRVTRIAPAAFGSATAAPTAPAQSQVVRFSVEVEIENVTPRVRPGMSAMVDLISAERANVLYVPNDVLRREPAASGNGRRAYVHRLASDEPRKVYVTTGLATEAFTEIRSGLAKGDRVVALGPEGMPERKTVQVNSGGGMGGYARRSAGR